MELPKRVKLSKQAVLINYGYLSPFKKFDVFYFVEGRYLYLWFIDTAGELIQGRIPECALILLFLKKKKDGIYVVEKKEECIVNVVESGVIREQIVLDCRDLDPVIEVLLVKYSFGKENVFFIRDLSCSVYDVIHLYSKVFYERIKEILTKNGTSILFFALIVLYLIVLNNFAFSFFLEKRIEKLRAEFKQTVELSRSYQDKLLFIESSIQVWKNLSDSLSIANVFRIYNSISRLSKDTGVKIQNLSISGSEAKLVIIAKNTNFMEKLMKLPYLKNVRLISSSTFGKENKYFVEFEIDLQSFNCR